MFERYTEEARRVIFFARYEASQLGSGMIESEHLLLGLLRGSTGVAARFLREGQISALTVRRSAGWTEVQPVSTEADLPLSTSARRALKQAAWEADRLAHARIASEHLLLGLLSESDGLAAQILTEGGVRLARVRHEVARLARKPKEGVEEPAAPRSPRMGDIVHYHTRQGSGFMTEPAIITSVVEPRAGRVSLTVFSPGKAPRLVPDAPPGPLTLQPEHEKWTWPAE